VSADPGLFLSTVILASAGLVAIIGGLLVARFVGLDSDERSNRKVLTEAAGRLASARRRAADARYNLHRWEARDFLTDSGVLSAISAGDTQLDRLRQLADCSLSDQEITPFVAEVTAEFATARRVLDGCVPEPGDDWEGFRRTIPDMPVIRWPSVWRRVFAEICDEHAEEIARKGKALEAAWRAHSPLGLVLPDYSSLVTKSIVTTDYRAINARRHDELIVADERAQQRVEDLGEEVRRLEDAHGEIIRPDARLWRGAGILVVFAAVGVGLPLWYMSRGVSQLAKVQWLVYPFGGALVTLLAYIVVYLAQLGSRRPPVLATRADTEVADSSTPQPLAAEA
jgi:hypothetical protein